MGLTDRLARAAVRRPHVLLVPVPGQRTLRWGAEDALDQLGWGRATSPAEADVLLSCGDPGRDLAEHIEVAWEGMPGPRARAFATTTDEVGAALHAAVRELADLPSQRHDARTRTAARLSAADQRDAAPEPPDEQAMPPDENTMSPDEAEPDHDGMDLADAGMGGMDHSMDMDMELPGGLVMADRVEDRDGLRLEGLNLSLGPLLPGWPAGLRLDVLLSGDVLTRADVVRLDPRPEPAAPGALLALDALAMLLEAAGWSEGALRARRARAAGGAGPATDDLLRRLRRARLLRWSLRGLPAPGGGDLVDHLDRLVAVMRDDAQLPEADDADLAHDVVGLDLGTAALVVAAHAPLQPAPARV